MRSWFILCVLAVLTSLKCKDGLRFVPSNELIIGFYNMDNLYDTEDDPLTNDNEFTPEGRFKWTQERYQHKLKAMSRVITSFQEGFAPDILGMCEVENGKVLSDLLHCMHAHSLYAAVHFDSEDERGSDAALIYNKTKLRLLDSRPYAIRFKNDTADRTRDLLWVKFAMLHAADTFQMVVCHFPSRRGGVAKSEEKRLAAAAVLKDMVLSQCRLQSDKLIICGDFNDEPGNKSIQSVLGAANPESDTAAVLQNLMWGFKQQGQGTYRYKGQWNMLDQFILSLACTKSGPGRASYVPNSVFIKQDAWMIQTGKYKGYPLRTFGGSDWLNGYSDHFPAGIRITIQHNGKN